MSTYADLGEKSIATQLYQKYHDCGVNLKGLQLLARRALSRGYSEMVVSYCLETVIKKNYKRDQYHGDDALDERRYISDAEFRAIMRYGTADDILWC